MENKPAGPLRQEGEYPVDPVRGYVGGTESSHEGGGVDIVEASFCVQEKGGDLKSRSLEGFYFVFEGKAGVGGAKSWQGATLILVE